MRKIREPFGETASKLKSPCSTIDAGRERACARSATSRRVSARGKLVRGSIRTSVRRSAESPLADPSYATAGIVHVPGQVCMRTICPPSRRVASTIVCFPTVTVTYRTGHPELRPPTPLRRRSAPAARRPPRRELRTRRGRVRQRRRATRACDEYALRAVGGPSRPMTFVTRASRTGDGRTRDRRRARAAAACGSTLRLRGRRHGRARATCSS